MMNKSALISQLRSFGLDTNGAQIYLTLLESGPTTPLELSRLSGHNRTSIYRYLEVLKNLGVVEEVIDEHRTLSKAKPPEQLKLLITQSEAHIDQLKHELPALIEDLSRLESSAVSPTKVMYFRGKNGLQQMLWNLLKIPSGGEFVGYGFTNWNEVVGQSFAEKLRFELVHKDIRNREVTNTLGPVGFTANDDYFNRFWEERYIAPGTIEIKHESYIYLDVFAFCHFHNGELFGVEIHNHEIAKTQRQIFEVLWKSAKKSKLTTKSS